MSHCLTSQADSQGTTCLTPTLSHCLTPQADSQGTTCGDLLVDKEEMASLLTEPLEELINRHGAFPDDRRVSWRCLWIDMWFFIYFVYYNTIIVVVSRIVPHSNKSTRQGMELI